MPSAYDLSTVAVFTKAACGRPKAARDAKRAGSEDQFAIEIMTGTAEVRLARPQNIAVCITSVTASIITARITIGEDIDTASSRLAAAPVVTLCARCLCIKGLVE